MDEPTELLRADQIEEAASLLAAGRLVAIPTETVYGLAADAESPSAVAGIFTAKGRPADQPLIVHILPEWADRYAAEWGPVAQKLADAFWPGPLTIVVPKTDAVPLEVTGGLDSVGLRAPAHPVARDVLEALGQGVAAPSANRYGHVSPTTSQHVLDDLDGRIAAVLDAGSSDVGLESTIVAVDRDSIGLLRRGAITADQLEAVGGVPVEDRTAGPVQAPGMVLSHYAPDAPVEIITALPEELGSDVLVISAVPVDHVRSVVLEGDAAFAAGLYDALRLGDDPAVVRVVVVPPTSGPLVPAILDRLTRAAHRS